MNSSIYFNKYVSLCYIGDLLLLLENSVLIPLLVANVENIFVSFIIVRNVNITNVICHFHPPCPHSSPSIYTHPSHILISNFTFIYLSMYIKIN